MNRIDERHLDPEELAGLTMLEHDDPMYREALQHTARCERCRTEWATAQRSLSLLDDAFPADMAPPPDLLARGLRIEAQAGQSSWIRWALTGIVAALGVLLAWSEIGETVVAQSAIKCASVELLAAAAGVASLVMVLRRRGGSLVPASGALAAGLGALVGEFYLHMACGEHQALHVLWAHGGTLVLACVLGALAASALRKPLALG